MMRHLQHGYDRSNGRGHRACARRRYQAYNASSYVAISYQDSLLVPFESTYDDALYTDQDRRHHDRLSWPTAPRHTTTLLQLCVDVFSLSLSLSLIYRPLRRFSHFASTSSSLTTFSCWTSGSLLPCLHISSIVLLSIASDLLGQQCAIFKLQPSQVAILGQRLWSFSIALLGAQKKKRNTSRVRPSCRRLWSSWLLPGNGSSSISFPFASYPIASGMNGFSLLPLPLL